MSGAFESQAAHAPFPGPGTKAAFTTSSSSIDLSAHEGKWLIFVVTAPVHLRSGSAAQTATTNDVLFPANSPQQFKVTSKRKHVGLIAPAAGGGDFHYAVVDED